MLDYAVTNPYEIITYRASDMVIDGHIDASYFFVSSSRSRAGVHFYMTEESETPLNNGAVMTTSKIIKAVMSSAAEAELCTLFVNCRESIPAQIVLKEMGHKHTPTPMQTDNTTALGVVNKTFSVNG